MGSFGGEGHDQARSHGGSQGNGRLLADRYLLGARLGRGGMGTVWRATDQLLGRQVAVKELHCEDGLSEAEAHVQRERTLREARTVAQIKHPSVIVLHDVVEEDDRPWIVMELVDGGSLADRLSTGGPLAPREAARIGVALLGALRVAHARGVLHRDIKPANVLLEAGSGRVVLTDFGIAQVPGVTTLTETGAFVGSPEYTAPERMAGQAAGPEADLWSLGVLLCVALSGVSPFRRDSLGGVLHAVVHDAIELPEAARPLQGVVRGLLERDPAARLGVTDTELLLRGYLHSGRSPDPAAVPALAPARPPVPVPHPGDRTHSRMAPGTRLPSGRTPGVPIPDALADRALAAAARPHTGRARAVLIAALAALVLAGTGAGIAALVLNRGEADGDRDGRPTQSHSLPTPGPGSASATPGPTPPSSPSPPAPTLTAKAPSGYRLLRDPAGFALAVPEGFTRSYEKPRVYYYSPGKRFRLGIHLQPQGPGGPLGTMRAADAKGPDTYPGYRAGEVTRTTHNGFEAALWEFVWNGGPEDGGPRHTYDLSWNEGGRMYDVWISAPVGERAAAKRHFDTALDTFQVIGAGG